jgi:hypothetical protein
MLDFKKEREIQFYYLQEIENKEIIFFLKMVLLLLFLIFFFHHFFFFLIFSLNIMLI